MYNGNTVADAQGTPIIYAGQFRNHFRVRLGGDPYVYFSSILPGRTKMKIRSGRPLYSPTLLNRDSAQYTCYQENMSVQKWDARNNIVPINVKT